MADVIEDPNGALSKILTSVSSPQTLSDPRLGANYIVVPDGLSILTFAGQVESASVNSAGDTLTINWNFQAVQGSGYAGDLTLDINNGGSTYSLTLSSGGGTKTWTMSIGSTVQQGDTVALDFAGSADAIEDNAGTDLGAFSGVSVTNNSTQGAGVGTLAHEWLMEAALNGSGGVSSIPDQAGSVDLSSYEDGHLTDTSLNGYEGYIFDQGDSVGDTLNDKGYLTGNGAMTDNASGKQEVRFVIKLTEIDLSGSVPPIIDWVDSNSNGVKITITDTSVEVRVGGSSNFLNTSSITDVNDGAVQHEVRAIYNRDGSGKWRLILDGTEVASTSGSAFTPPTSTEVKSFGSFNSGFPERALYDLKIYT